MENLKDYLKNFEGEELVIESNKEALDDFNEFISKHPKIAQAEFEDSMDGTEIISLIIENAPDYIEAIVALITLLRKKKINHEIPE